MLRRLVQHASGFVWGASRDDRHAGQQPEGEKTIQQTCDLDGIKGKESVWRAPFCLSGFIFCRVTWGHRTVVYSVFQHRLIYWLSRELLCWLGLHHWSFWFPSFQLCELSRQWTPLFSSVQAAIMNSSALILWTYLMNLTDSVSLENANEPIERERPRNRRAQPIQGLLFLSKVLVDILFLNWQPNVPLVGLYPPIKKKI